MSFLSNPRFQLSRGATLFSRRPVVFLRVEAPPPDAQQALIKGRSAALEALGGALEATETDAQILRAAAARSTEGLNGHLLAGDLVARLATCLLHKAGAPEGEFDIITGFDRDVIAFWNDWMEGVGVYAGHHAVRLMETAFAAPAELRDAMHAALAAVLEARIDPFFSQMVLAAEARGIPWRSLRRGYPVLSYGQGARQQWFHGTMSNLQSRACVHLTTRKHLSARLLRAAGLPVPVHEIVDSPAEATAAAERIGFPVVVKPDAGSRSANVFLDLMGPAEVEEAALACLRLGMRPLVEKQHPGLPYRVTVCDGRAFGALLHAIPFVTGDGKTSLRDLIERTSSARRRVVEDDYRMPLPLRMEEVADQMQRRLAQQGIALDDIPQAGRRILLTLTPTLSQGGLHRDVTEEMHPDTLMLAEEAARVLRAPHLGVDLLITDIRKSHAESPLVINEVNAAPGVRSHVFVEGPPRDLPEALFASCFPSGSQGRIPIAAAVGDSMVECFTLLTKLMNDAGETAGFADSSRAVVDGYTLKPMEGATVHPGCALLRDKRPSIAALVLNFGDIVSRGVPSDHLDTIVISRDTLAGELLPYQRAALERIADLPGDSLVLPAEAATDGLREVAAHRRVVLVAGTADGGAFSSPDVTVVTAERRQDSVWLVAHCNGSRTPLGRIALPAYRENVHPWAAAQLLGLDWDALEIARLISANGAEVVANLDGKA